MKTAILTRTIVGDSVAVIVWYVMIWPYQA